MSDWEFDLFAAESEPVPRKVWTTYHFTLPSEIRRKLAEQGKVTTYPWVYIEVDDFGNISIDANRSHWFDTVGDDTPSTLRKLVYDWLNEWEYITLQPIGPEDHEWFITDKFDRIVNNRGGAVT